MKTKDVFKRMALLVWVMALAIGFTACSSDDDELYVVTYSTATSLTASGEDALSVVKAISDYSTALNQVMGGSFCTTDKDAEVIEACDKVFEKHQALYPSLKGYVEIRKTVGTTSSPDEELPSTVVKTYTYE